MRHRSAALMFATLAVAVASAPGAQPDRAEGEPDPVRARLVSEWSALVPGRVNILGVVFEIDEGWHIYWPGQNDTGLPTTITLDLPEGYEAKEMIFPAPHRYVSPGDLLDHVYERTTLVLVPVVVPSDAVRGEQVTLRAQAEWLMCREACIPGWDGELSLTIPIVNSAAEATRMTESALFREARARAARPVGSALGAIDTRVTRSDGLAVRVRVEGARRLAFYPDAESSIVASLLASGERAGDELELRIDRPNDARTLSGVLEVWGPGDEPPSRVYRLDVPLDEPKDQPGQDSPAGPADAG